MSHSNEKPKNASQIILTGIFLLSLGSEELGSPIHRLGSRCIEELATTCSAAVSAVSTALCSSYDPNSRSN